MNGPKIPGQVTAWRKEFAGMLEAQVRLLAEPDPSKLLPEPKSVFAKVWLAERAEAKRNTREETILSIAKEANRIAAVAEASARASSRWAMYAAITAVIALAFAAKDQILALIVGHP